MVELGDHKGDRISDLEQAMKKQSGSRILTLKNRPGKFRKGGECLILKIGPESLGKEGKSQGPEIGHRRGV